MSVSRVRHHTGGLVNHGEVLILVKDRDIFEPS